MKSMYYRFFYNIEAFIPQAIVSKDIIKGYYPPHRHDFIEIYYVISGTGIEIVNGKKHTLNPGCVVLLLPWNIHEIQSSQDDPLIIYKCDFNIEFVLSEGYASQEIKDMLFDNANKRTYIQCQPEESQDIQNIFEALKKELDTADIHRNAMVKIKLMELLIKYHRSYVLRIGINEQKNNYIDEEEKGWDIIYYIHTHLETAITLSHVAKRFNLSESSTSRIIKELTNQSFSDLLNEARIRLACAYLSHEDIPIAIISRIVGYQSASTFYRAFKDIKGVPFDIYRKNVIQKQKDKGKYIVMPYSDLVWKIIYYIHLHFKEDLHLVQIARQMNYCESYLREMLKSFTGQNFTELLQEIRVMYGASLLASTNMPIQEISLEVGFNSRETFYRCFQKIKGMSSSTYRKKESYYE